MAMAPTTVGVLLLALAVGVPAARVAGPEGDRAPERYGGEGQEGEARRAGAVRRVQAVLRRHQRRKDAAHRRGQREDGEAHGGHPEAERHGGPAGEGYRKARRGHRAWQGDVKASTTVREIEN